MARSTAPSDLRQRVDGVLRQIRPAVQLDGGDVELVDVDDEGTVTVRFKGACVTCPSRSLTLQSNIERNLRDHIPEIRAVRATNAGN